MEYEANLYDYTAKLNILDETIRKHQPRSVVGRNKNRHRSVSDFCYPHNNCIWQQENRQVEPK